MRGVGPATIRWSPGFTPVSAWASMKSWWRRFMPTTVMSAPTR